jgi:hypothetical protein
MLKSLSNLHLHRSIVFSLVENRSLSSVEYILIAVNRIFEFSERESTVFSFQSDVRLFRNVQLSFESLRQPLGGGVSYWEKTTESLPGSGKCDSLAERMSLINSC